MLDIIDALQTSRMRVWLDGGWGVDALLGEQTRTHEDVDLVVELAALREVIATLGRMRFALAEDGGPTRVVLRATDDRQVDLHPVRFDEGGTGWQVAAGPDGSDCAYPPWGFGEGHILGRMVPCLTAELQLRHHCGYEPREHDRADMAQLAVRFGLTLPAVYLSSDRPASIRPEDPGRMDRW